MTVLQKIIALLTLVTIGGMLLYAAYQDSIYTGISIKKGLAWDFITNMDLNKILNDIRTYIGLLSIGLGIFIFAGRRKKG